VKENFTFPQKLSLEILLFPNFGKLLQYRSNLSFSKKCEEEGAREHPVQVMEMLHGGDGALPPPFSLPLCPTLFGCNQPRSYSWPHRHHRPTLYKKMNECSSFSGGRPPPRRHLFHRFLGVRGGDAYVAVQGDPPLRPAVPCPVGQEQEHGRG
jgi:hypothetical protein